MARFKFGKKKKDDPDDSLGSTAEERHSYLHRSLSKRHTFLDAQSTTTNDSGLGGPENRSATDLAHGPIPGQETTTAHGLNGNSAPSHQLGGGRAQDSPYGAASAVAASHDAHTDPSPAVTASSPWKKHKLFDSPFPRYRHAAALVSSEKNDIFLMGGLKDGSVFGDTWKITPHLSPSGKDIDTLTAHHIEVVNNNNPPARVGHSSVLCGNAYIIYGGDTVDTDYNGFPDDNFYMFNINNRKYTIPLHILNKPRGRYGHLIGVVSLNSSTSRLYLFGGQLENDVYNDMYYFELTSFKLPKARWELVEPLNNLKPPPLTNHTMSVYKSKLYVFGGVYNNEKVSNDLWCFDSNANKWQQLLTLGDIPFPVNEHSACLVADRLYVYGGNDFSGVIYDTLYCLNLQSMKWSKLPKDLCENAPGPRCGHSMTFLPKLNKLLIMGGDKNDYIYSDPKNYSTYENYNGQELGTMVYELDVISADHFMRNGAEAVGATNEHPKKLAASASGGAAGVLNRRAASPQPSEDAFTRHRRSLSAGIEEFKTPNGSSERINRSLDPKHSGENGAAHQYEGGSGKAELEVPLVANGARSPDKFVEVDIPSSSAVSELDNSSHFQSKLVVGENETAVASSKMLGEDDTATPYEVSDEVQTDEPLFSGRDNKTPEFDEAGTLFNGHLSPDIDPAAGAFAGASVSNGSSEPKPTDPEKAQTYDSKDRRITAPSKAPSHDEESVKRIIAQLNTELSELKANASAQMQAASDQMQAASAQMKEVEQENAKLKAEYEARLKDQQETHQRELEEKERLLGELRNSVDPQELAISEDADTTSISTGRGFTELTKYKLDRLELRNKLVYLEAENSQLKERQGRFEPFMQNQIGEISTLQKIIKGQEDRIAALTATVKLELHLQKEIVEWRHKYEDLSLEFEEYRALNAEVAVDDQGGDGEETGSKPSGRISNKLDSLIEIWKNTSQQDDEMRLLASQDRDVVSKLQQQIDSLLRTSKAQHDGSKAEVEELQNQLQSKLVSLKTFEENYRDALQSVKNTSKALDLTQDELKNQRITMDRLIKENNELKLFKKAATAAKRATVMGSVGDNINDPEAVYGDASPNEDEEFNFAHYNMKLKDLEADLYIMRQERDQLNDTVASLKKELYLAKSA